MATAGLILYLAVHKALIISVILPVILVWALTTQTALVVTMELTY